MEEWQRRMKAEKNAERQKKTESAEILRGYRGELHDEDLKSKALREEERKRHLDAQQNLHSYKGAQLEGGGKPKEQRPEQHYPTPVNSGQHDVTRDLMEGIVTGSVSERAAALAASAGAGFEPLVTPTMSQQQVQQHAFVAASADDAVDDDDVDDDDDDNFGPAMPASPALETSSIPVFAPTDDLFAVQRPVDEPILYTPPVDPLSITTAFVPPTSKAVVLPNSTSLEEPADAATPNMETSMTPAAPNGTTLPTLIRLEVLFTFGLVTVQSQPEMASYMAAVSSIVTKSLNTGSNAIIYDPSYAPFVRDMQWDGMCIYIIFRHLATITCF